MKTLSRVAIAMIGMTGLVAAQPRPGEPRPGEPKPGEPKPPEPRPGGTAEMKPPAELAERAKATAGTWRCKGQALDHTMQMKDMTGTLRTRVDLDGWWLHSSFESKVGKEPFRFESFETFDPTSRTWKAVMVETGGGWSTGESAGMKDRKVDWELTTHSAMGEAMFRDHADMSDPKAGARLSGEVSTDKGKTWTKVYEMACKK